jgi:hypothetical protein
MKEVIEIVVPKFHHGQQYILSNSKRFNVVACGRRFGKTEMAKRLLLNDKGDNGALKGYPVAYFAPTYKMLMEVWRGINESYHKLIVERSEQEKRVKLVTGGSIEFWSFDSYDSVRGRKYKRVVLDECAIIGSDKLKNGWEQSIRALLTDYKGDAWFLSTPKGKKHYFRSLFENTHKDPKNWSSFQMPTVTNPFIDPSEVEDARVMLPPVVFSQEYLAEFTDMKSGNLFLYTFDRHKHVPMVPYGLDKKYPLIISFDFNVNPITAIICQHDLHYKWIRVIGEYRMLNSDIYELCDRIKSDWDTRQLIVTGDAAGWNRNASTRGHKSMFDIISVELKLNWSQIKTPRGKPAGYVQDKRNLANALFARHPEITLSNCPYLIEDIENVEDDGSGHMNKDKDGTKSHLLDCLCDFLYIMCKESVKVITKMPQNVIKQS